MTKLPIVSGKEVIKALSKIGYYVRGQKGSHIHLRHPERMALTVPNHDEIATKGAKGAKNNFHNLCVLCSGLSKNEATDTYLR